MARSYDLNPESAKQADRGGDYIDETGKYIGTFTRAEAVTSQQGTEGIEFTFKAEHGASADFLTVWTHRQNGEELQGNKAVNAIMTCMRVKTMAPKEASVEKYDSTTKTRTMQRATVYPELMNKPVGVLLQKVWRADKPDKYKFEIFGVFDAQTELTASEILTKASEPVRLAKMVLALKDKDEKPRSGARSASGAAPAAGGTFDDFDSDVPFTFIGRGMAAYVI